MSRVLRTLSVVLALVIVACGDDAIETDRLQIIATTSVWGDVVSEIAGDDVAVAVLIPRGADAHEYQATSRQVAAIADADLVVANGLGLEEGLHDILETAETDGANVLEVAPGLDPLPFAIHRGQDDTDRGDLDPHVWFDPERVARATTLIADELAALHPAIDWAGRAATYIEKLTETDDAITRRLETISSNRRKLVTNHDALGYLAHRYDFEVVGVVIPGGSTLGEPSSAELATLVAVIEEEEVPAIFAETSQPKRLAEAVATEVGDDVVVIELFTESLGEPGTAAGTLIGMLIENAERIARALG